MERKIRDEPPRIGYVRTRKAIELHGVFYLKRSLFVIELADSGERVRAVTGRYLLDKVPDEVRFYYSGDPSREVFLLDYEEDPLWIGLFIVVAFNLLLPWVYTQQKRHMAKKSATNGAAERISPGTSCE